MSESKIHTGGCHCGKVRYQATLDLLKPVIACNCSMCGRAGTLLSFVPAAQFTLQSGQEELISYQFNKHVIDHLFCRVCGVKSFARGKSADGGEMAAINVRCLDNVELDQLTVTKFDGQSR